MTDIDVNAPVHPDEPIITVIWTCEQCGIIEAQLPVRARRKNEDILVWMERLQNTLGMIHHQRSPHCTATELTQLKIPLPPGTNRIGGVPEN